MCLPKQKFLIKTLDFKELFQKESLRKWKPQSQTWFLQYPEEWSITELQ